MNKKAIDNINKYFGWDLIQYNMTATDIGMGDIIKFKEIDGYSLQYVFDYLVITSKHVEIDKIKHPKKYI